jgi:hypothetical protein
MDESKIHSVKNITLQTIPENRDLFRADYYPNCYVVSENKIEDEEFEVMKFTPLDEKFDSVIHL